MLDRLMADNVSGAVPVLLTVTLCAALVLPMAVVASVSEVGEMLAAGAVTDTPVPDSAMAIGVNVLLCEMLSVPVRLPAAVGVNDTITVHPVVEPVATVVPQVPPERAKSPLVPTVRPLIPGPFCRLGLMVTVCVAAVAPTFADPKVKVDGELPR